MANESQIARLLEIDEQATAARETLVRLEESAAIVMHRPKGDIAVCDFVSGGSGLKTFLERLGHSVHF